MPRFSFLRMPLFLLMTTLGLVDWVVFWLIAPEVTCLLFP
jgi:hypothetical protein